MVKFNSPYETDWGQCDKELFAFNVKEWRYQKPVTNLAKCCQCGLCYFSCPTGCIHSHDNQWVANLEYCKGCGICARVCPVEAIQMVRGE